METLRLSYRQVHPLNVSAQWEKLAPWILIAVGADATHEDATWLKDRAHAGLLHIWVGETLKEEIEMVLVTEPIHFAGKSTLVLRWVAGSRAFDFLQDLATLEMWAKHHGFEHMHVCGRKGWERELAPYGFTHEFTTLGKSLVNGVH